MGASWVVEMQLMEGRRWRLASIEVNTILPTMDDTFNNCLSHFEVTKASGLSVSSSFHPLVSGVAGEGHLVGETGAVRVWGPKTCAGGAMDWAQFWPWRS